MSVIIVMFTTLIVLLNPSLQHRPRRFGISAKIETDSFGTTLRLQFRALMSEANLPASVLAREYNNVVKNALDTAAPASRKAFESKTEKKNGLIMT